MLLSSGKLIGKQVFFCDNIEPVQDIGHFGFSLTGAGPDEAGEILAAAVVELMRKTGMPNGLSAVGYTPEDVDGLVEGTLPQHRVTKLCPRPFTADDLRRLFLESMQIW